MTAHPSRKWSGSDGWVTNRRENESLPFLTPPELIRRSSQKLCRLWDAHGSIHSTTLRIRSLCRKDRITMFLRSIMTSTESQRPYGAHFVLRIARILVKEYYNAIINGVKRFDFPPLPIDYGYRDSKNWYHKHRWMKPELLPQRETTVWARPLFRRPASGRCRIH